MVFSKHPPIAPEDFLEEFLGLEAVFAGRVGRCAENISVRPWPRRQWSIWQVLLQYLVLHIWHRGASWASGAAQAAQVVRIILLWRGVCGAFARRELLVGLKKFGFFKPSQAARKPNNSPQNAK